MCFYRSLDSYIGRDDFFQGSNLLFRGLSSDFLCEFISSVKRIAISTIIEQQKCEGHEKRDRLAVLKLEFENRISQRNKKYNFVSNRCNILV